MIDDIYNFIGSYPNVNNYDNDILNSYDNNFYLNIYKKKEFYENRLGEEQEPPTKFGPVSAYNHQKILATYMNIYTTYDRVLLLQKMGSGKSLASISCIEIIRSENSSIKGALVLAPGETLLDNFKEEIVFKATFGKYIKDYRTEKEKVHRINKELSKFYEFDTFQKFAKKLKNYTDDQIIQLYSNKIIVIDEVHNIRTKQIKALELFSDDVRSKLRKTDPRLTSAEIKEEIKKQWSELKKPENIDMMNTYVESAKSLIVYEQIYRFLHLIKNSKIILMSATPMKDKLQEISDIMNLILPTDRILPTGESFIKMYFDKKGEEIIIKEDKINDLKNLFKGYISYLDLRLSNINQNYKSKL